MLLSTVGKLFARPRVVPVTAAPAAMVLAPIPVAPRPVASVWPPARLALTHRLWGDGFGCPGGEAEVVRLTRSLGLSPATSLLLVGGGGGGAACALTREFGTWVAAVEADADLVDAGHAMIARMDVQRKVAITRWDPDKPVFETRKYHHCLAIEPLTGSQAEPILDGLSRALKPGGQLVMTDLVADDPLPVKDAGVTRWGALERRDPAEVQSSVAVGRMLGRVGLDVRIAEDITGRHADHIVQGWRRLLRNLPAKRPDAANAALLVREAEQWLLRWRLLRDGRLRVMRWHAINRAA
jgi:SAM-dependent methyltransferase